MRWSTKRHDGQYDQQLLYSWGRGLKLEQHGPAQPGGAAGSYAAIYLSPEDITVLRDQLNAWLETGRVRQPRAGREYPDD